MRQIIKGHQNGIPEKQDSVPSEGLGPNQDPMRTQTLSGQRTLSESRTLGGARTLLVARTVLVARTL